jgi:hypothetical protein
LEILRCLVSKPTWISETIPLVAPDISQTVHKGLVWQIWQDFSSKFDPLK